MKKLLDPQNKIFAAIGFVGDHFLLGVLWVLCSLPVITGGAASAAACAVSRKLCTGEEQKLIPDFFRAFRREFLLATKLWLLVLGIGAVLAVDVYVYFTVAAGSPIFLGFTGLLVLVYLICLCWMYPYTAVFQGGFVRTVKMSFLLGMSNLGWSAVLLAIDLGLVLLTLYAPFLTLFLPGLFTLSASLVTGRAFRKYLPKPETE